MDFTVNSFKGSNPRMADHLGQKQGASFAMDCEFSSGCLDSFREPAYVRDVEPGTTVTYQHLCCWHDFKGCVDAAYGSVTCKQMFVTGAFDHPVVITADEECNISIRRLGLPCPHVAPSAVASDPNYGAERDIEGRSYCYQYVNSAGERSQLSPGCKSLNMYDGQAAVVSGWPVPDEEYDIVKVAIYRLVAGFSDGKEMMNKGEATWMLAGEVDVNAPSFTDTKWNEDLFIAPQEDIVMPPPEGLRGITWCETMNCLFGFVGNRIYASENNQYHNWPYYYDLDDNVCAIVEANGNLYVATDGAPYVIAAAVGCDHAGCRSIVKLHGRFPMIGCGQRRMVRCRAGAIYPSHKGLVLLAGKNNPTLLTWPLYSEKDWQAMRPQTATTIEYDGKIYCFMENGAFYMSLSQGPEQGWNMDFHCSLSDRNVTDAFVTRQGDFYIVKDGKQYLWNKGNTKRPHVYRTIEAVSPAPVGWGAGHLHFTNGVENIKVELDGRVMLDREVMSSRVFRLPMYAVGQRLYVTLYGTGRVSLMSLASSMRDLRSA